MLVERHAYSHCWPIVDVPHWHAPPAVVQKTLGHRPSLHPIAGAYDETGRKRQGRRWRMFPKFTVTSRLSNISHASESMGNRQASDVKERRSRVAARSAWQAKSYFGSGYV